VVVPVQVVIIYSPQDIAARDALSAALRKAGANVWYDAVSQAKDQALTAFRREARRRSVVLALVTREALESAWVKQQLALIHEDYQREPNRLLLALSAEQSGASDLATREWLRDYRRVELVEARLTAEVIERTVQLLTLSAARTVAQAADTLEDMVTRGKVLLAWQAYEEAAQALRRAVQLEAASFVAWFSLGYAYGCLVRWEEALEAYERALALMPGHAGGLNNKGEALYNLRRYQLALAAYEQAIELDAAYALKDPRMALADYERAITLDSDYAAPWNNRGVVYNDAGRQNEATAAFDRALRIDPRYAAAWNNRGNAQGDLRRYGKALNDYDRALALEPEYASAHYNKGNALYSLRRYRQAVASYDRALRAEPSNTAAWINKGAAQYELRDYDEALTSYNRALTLDANSLAAWQGKALTSRDATHV
jgi:tetratricopeptide (TPR) repeat protein